MGDTILNSEALIANMSELDVGGGDLTLPTPTSELQRILECPICKQIPLPPIYNCTKGHIVCGACRQQLYKCGLCQTNYTDSRNFTVEEIVQTSKIACEYREQGCRSILMGKDYRKHVTLCQFRPLRCYRGDSDGCKSTILELSNYARHLASVHKMKEYQHQDGRFYITHSLSDSRMTDAAWTGMFVRFDGNTFIAKSFMKSNMLHAVVWLVGIEADLPKYKVRLQFRKPGDADGTPFEMTIPVVSIRKTYDDIAAKSLHGIISKKMMKHFCKVESSSGLEKRLKYKWLIEYQIINV